ncbi:MAG: transporter [Caulobacter sp.]|nr:transporter [Caulobacter sp.]
MAIIIEKADPNEVAAPAPADAATGWRKWTEIFILLAAGMVTTLCFTAVVPALQLIAAYFKGVDSTFNAQLVVVAAPAGLAIGGFLAGPLVKALGIRRTLFLGLALSTLMGTCQLWVPSYWGLMASRFVLGLALICTDVSLSTLIGKRFVGRWRALLMGFRQAIGSVGTVGSFWVSAKLINHFGWRGPGWMFLLPAFFLLVALITFNKPISLSGEKADGSRALERFNVLQVWPIYVLALVMTICHAMPSFQMAFLLGEMNIHAPEKIALVPMISAGIGILTALVFGLIYGQIGRMTFVLASVSMGAGFIGMSLSPDYNDILKFVVLEGFGAGMTIPYFATRMLDRITAEQRARAMGYLMSAVFLGHVLNPFVLKPIRAQLGVHGAFTAVGAFLIVAGVLLSVLAFVTRGKPTIV